MLLSLSPGSSNSDWAKEVASEVSMYRVSDDTWDRWEQIKDHFLTAQQMQLFIAHPNGRYGLPAWPDLDMLPLGYLSIEGNVTAPVRYCNLTQDEQVTLMSLWTMFRSPLMYGGDLQHPEPFSLSLLTNREALAITDHSTNNGFVISNATTAVWRADSDQWQRDGRSYFSAHNLQDTNQTVTLTLTQLRGAQKSAGQCVMRDVWAKTDRGQFIDTHSFHLRPHASILYALYNCTSSHVLDHSNTRMRGRSGRGGDLDEAR